ncbi:MAG: ABC transporter permease, partial [Actinobacteria bacterium]|nr:ABC transporter permease [Actinomycetota bacterium]
MRRVWALLGKDLLQNYRDRLAFLFTFILPVVFTLFFGFLFGGSNTSSLPLAVANLDLEGAAALRIIEMLESSEVVAPRAFEAEEAERAVADNRVAAALLIPEGFSAGMDAGDAPAVTVVRQMESSGGQTAEQALRQVVSVVAGGRLAALVALRAVIPGAAPASHPTEWATALETAVGIMENPVLTLQVENSGTRIGETPRGFDMSSPGMLVNWVLFGLMGAAITLVLDRKSGV